MNCVLQDILKNLLPDDDESAPSEFILKFGRNIDVDSDEDVIDQGGSYPWLEIAESPLIMSTNAADDASPSGTGARTVRVEGLDGDYLPQSESVQLNGVSPVQLQKSYLRVHRAYVLSAGNEGHNVGDIDVVSSGGSILARIPERIGQTLQAIYTVPAKAKDVKIFRWWFNMSVSMDTTMAVGIQTRDFETNTWRTREWIEGRSGSSRANYRDMSPYGIVVQPKTDIRLRVMSISLTNGVISGGFDLSFRKN